MKKKKKQAICAYLFLAPSLLGVGILILAPFIDAIRKSFYSAIGGQFMGMANYLEVLQNEAFQLAAGNTAKFMAICVPSLFVLSLALTILVMSIQHKRGAVKMSFLIPMSIPVASGALLWKLLFERYGLINSLLNSLNFPVCDFINSQHALGILIGTYLWKNIGYDMVLWISGLSNIPTEYYEAAKLDGAGGLKCFFYITLPCLRPTIYITVIISFNNAFKVFREAYLIAGNYPHESIYMLQHIFNNWFVALDIQKMCAGAVLMAIVMFVMILLLGILNRREGEGA